MMTNMFVKLVDERWEIKDLHHNYTGGRKEKRMGVVRMVRRIRQMPRTRIGEVQRTKRRVGTANP